MAKTRKIVRYWQHQLKHNKTAFIVYSVLRALGLFVLVRSIITRNYEHAALCLLSLVLFLLPAFASETFKWEIPGLFQCIIYCEIFAGEILGEIGHYFTRFPGWDNILHTTTGFLAAAVGFSTIELLNKNSNSVKLSPFYLLRLESVGSKQD